MPSLTDNALAFVTSAGVHGKILLTLFIVLLAAKLMAEFFERLRQPAVSRAHRYAGRYHWRGFSLPYRIR